MEIKVKLGDKFRLGDHVLVCGDSTKEEYVSKLMQNDLADMVLTDPPFNVGYVGKTLIREGIKNDKLTPEQFREFLDAAIGNMSKYSKHGAMYYIFMAMSSFKTLMDVAKSNDLRYSTAIIWVKNKFVMGWADYHQGYEPIWYGWKNAPKRLHPQTDRTQSNVWRCDRPDKSKLHPTMKPIELIERAIRNSSNTDDIVLDLFGGSGSTLIACESTNRKCRMMELDTHYCEIIIQRYVDAFGVENVTRIE